KSRMGTARNHEPRPNHGARDVQLDQEPDARHHSQISCVLYAPELPTVSTGRELSIHAGTHLGIRNDVCAIAIDGCVEYDGGRTSSQRDGYTDVASPLQQYPVTGESFADRIFWLRQCWRWICDGGCHDAMASRSWSRRVGAGPKSSRSISKRLRGN